jgi:putative flippase GtrA
MQLIRIRLTEVHPTLLKFSLVGLSGLVVNTVLLGVLTSGFGLFYLVSAFLATEVSIAWNFALSERWVFVRRNDGRRRRLCLFVLVNSMTFVASGPLLWLFVSGAGLDYLVGNILSVSTLMLVRFLISDKLIWGDSPALIGLFDLHRHARKQRRSRQGHAARGIAGHATLRRPSRTIPAGGVATGDDARNQQPHQQLGVVAMVLGRGR